MQTPSMGGGLSHREARQEDQRVKTLFGVHVPVKPGGEESGEKTPTPGGPVRSSSLYPSLWIGFQYLTKSLTNVSPGAW